MTWLGDFVLNPYPLLTVQRKPFENLTNRPGDSFVTHSRFFWKFSYRFLVSLGQQTPFFLTKSAHWYYVSTIGSRLRNKSVRPYLEIESFVENFVIDYINVGFCRPNLFRLARKRMRRQIQFRLLCRYFPPSPRIGVKQNSHTIFRIKLRRKAAWWLATSLMTSATPEPTAKPCTRYYQPATIPNKERCSRCNIVWKVRPTGRPQPNATPWIPIAC